MLICLFIIINLIGFVLMYIDKKRAKYGRWRIPEKTLFLLPFVCFCFKAIIGNDLRVSAVSFSNARQVITIGQI